MSINSTLICISAIRGVSNAVPISSFIDNMKDTDLMDLIPYLDDMSSPHIEDIRPILANFLEFDDDDDDMEDGGVVGRQELDQIQTELQEEEG